MTLHCMIKLKTMFNMDYDLAVDDHDSLAYSKGWPFTTIDNDNDGLSSNCAETRQGGWW